MPVERINHKSVAGPSTSAITDLNDDQSITFAENVTPISFGDASASSECAQEGMTLLFPVSDVDPPPTYSRRGHRKKKPMNHIPRPPNAFILFRSHFIRSRHVSQSVETNHSTLSKIVGLTWQNLPGHERDEWHRKAKRALEEHKRKYPQYTFKPQHTKKSRGSNVLANTTDLAGEKRKTREFEPRDDKRCAKIAELLIQGKKGDELDDAIREFDMHHIPEIVTRFEVPLTEREYNPSSSGPVIDDARFVKELSSQEHRVLSPPAVQSAPCLQPDEQVSFAFDTFTFSHTSPSAPSIAYDPLAPPPLSAPATLPSLSSFAPTSTDDQLGCNSVAVTVSMPTPRRNLSIDTSFLSDWYPHTTPSPMTSCPSAASCSPKTPLSGGRALPSTSTSSSCDEMFAASGQIFPLASNMDTTGILLEFDRPVIDHGSSTMAHFQSFHEPNFYPGYGEGDLLLNICQPTQDSLPSAGDGYLHMPIPYVPLPSYET